MWKERSSALTFSACWSHETVEGQRISTGAESSCLFFIALHSVPPPESQCVAVSRIWMKKKSDRAESYGHRSVRTTNRCLEGQLETPPHRSPARPGVKQRLVATAPLLFHCRYLKKSSVRSLSFEFSNIISYQGQETPAGAPSHRSRGVLAESDSPVAISPRLWR
jgi:hypothetical protein